MNWPKSLPDYQWPPQVRAEAGIVRRLMRAAAFHVAHFLGRVVSLVRREPAGVLIIRTDGLGDAVLAEPLMASLAARFRGRRLHLWAPLPVCELMRAAPYVAELCVVPRGFKNGNLLLWRSAAWRWRLGYQLGRYRFETAAYLCESPEPLGNWLLRSARARQRWFNPGDLQNQFPAQQAATASAATRVFEPDGDGHELARGIRLAGQWGGDVRRKPPAIHLDSFASDEAHEQYARWQRGLRFEIPGDELRINVGDEAMAGPTASSPIIGLMPASALPVKGYPLSAWATVVRQLWHEEGLVCALLGGPDDQAQVDALASQLGSVPYLRLSRPLDVLAMAALIRRLDGLLSVDTGLAHLAIAQNVPAVILRSGAHPGRFFPWPGNHEAIVLSHAMPCEGCACRCHLSEAECLTRIEPGDVVLAARRLFTKPRQVKVAV